MRNDELIKVIQYEDPYSIDTFDFWKNSSCKIHLCASEGLKDGLLSLYNTKDRIILTVNEVIKRVYENWTANTVKFIEQYIKINSRVAKSYQHNRENILNSFRLLMELEITPAELSEIKDTIDGDINDLDYYYMYEKFYNSEGIEDQKNFEGLVAAALKKITEDNKVNSENEECSIEDVLPLEEIYIYGLYQFTPIIIRFLNQCCKNNIKIILVNNYSEKYKAIYNTWDSVYSNIRVDTLVKERFLGESKCINEFHKIALLLEDLENERISTVSMNKLKLTSFSSLLEYAEFAKKSTMTHFVMSDEIKCILGSRKDDKVPLGGKPLGIFILSLYNLIDYTSETENVKFNNGKLLIKYDKSIYKEMAFYYEFIDSTIGNLFPAINKLEFYLRDCRTIEQVEESVARLIGFKKEVKQNEFNGLEFWNITINELEGVIEFLGIIKSKCKKLFNFYNNDINISDHYKNLDKILIEYLNKAITRDNKELQNQITVLQKRISDIDYSKIEYCSFNDLKYSIGYYINPTVDRENNKDKYNIMGIENVEGGIWGVKGDVHFGYLSDEHINQSRNYKIPWPLTAEIIEKLEPKANNIFDKNIFLSSIIEYADFIRYSLFYGFVFARNPITISYIKSIGNNNYSPYYLFNMLNIEEEYNPEINQENSICNSKLNCKNIDSFKLNRIDKYTFKFCPYRFLLEKIINEEESSIFKGEYCTIKYSGQIIKHFTLQWCSKLPRSINEIRSYITGVSNRLIEIVPSLKRVLDLLDIQEEILNFIITNKKNRFNDSLYFIKYYSGEATTNFIRLVTNQNKIYEVAGIDIEIEEFINKNINKKNNNMCIECTMQYVCLQRFIN